MDQDDKTARGHRGVPVVRATPPVGTPLGPHHAPPVTPAPSASQPRTVGGFTARLAAGEEDALSIDPLGSSSLPYDPKRWEALDSAAPPASQTVGGTARLDTVSPEEAAAAERIYHDGSGHDGGAREPPQTRSGHDGGAREPPQTRSGHDGGAREPPQTRSGHDGGAREPRGPEGDPGPQGTGPQGTSAKASPIPQGTPQPVAGAPRGAASDDASTLSLLFAPLSVGVGLVFFAMGSMITLTVDGRLAANRAQSAVNALGTMPPPGAPSSPPPPAVSVAAAPHPTGSSPAATLPASAAPPGPSKPVTSSAPASTGKPGGAKGIRPIF